MAAVAAEAGLSTGAIYSYVESKEALFHLVFAFGFGEIGEGLPDLPIATPPFEDTLAADRSGAAQVASRRLGCERHWTRSAPIGCARRVGCDHRRAVRSDRAGVADAGGDRAVARWICPSSDAFYFQRGRRGYLGQLTRYLELRVRGGYFGRCPTRRSPLA